ncbi:MAG: 50S ribosomal protein L9 [Dehalococcoidales bacterium]|nr:50S ribosomal protein L9 [Dehalococcoidales bacterium]
MKVIFLQDVPNVAKSGDTKEVADGYARNFLIPQKLALQAKPGAVNVLEVQLKMKARSQAQTEAELNEMGSKLEGKEIILKGRTGAKDRLYGSVTAADIAAEIEKTIGLIVDKRKIELVEPIRQVGSYDVVIRLTKDVIPKIKVTVTEEGAG